MVICQPANKRTVFNLKMNIFSDDASPAFWPTANLSEPKRKLTVIVKVFCPAVALGV